MVDLHRSQRWAILGSVFCVSFSVLAFEIGLTRAFAALLQYHYAFLVVSGSVCGLGIGGLLVHFMTRGALPHPSRAGWAALGFALLTPSTIALLFGAPALLSSTLLAALAPLAPFAFAGAYLAEAFRQRAGDSGRLYEADLLGAGLAAVAVIPLIGRAGALNLAFVLGGTAALGAAYWAFHSGGRALLISSAISALLLPALWPLSARTDFLDVRPPAGASPAIAKLLVTPDSRAAGTIAVLDSEWSAYARTDLVRSDSPTDGYYTLGIYTDGDTPSIMLPFWGDLAQASQTHWLADIALAMYPHGSMLSIGPGAGLDFLRGATVGFERMVGVEVNASLARMVRRYRAINGGIYDWPGVTVCIEDGRSFVRRSTDQYDLIMCSLTQTATTGGLGYALVESYIHTQQAFADYYAHLRPEGRYAIITQSYAFLLRAAFTALDVMRDQGIEPRQACGHLAALALPDAETQETPYRYLLIWKKTPLTDDDAALLMRAIDAGLAEPVFLPGLPGEGPLYEIASGAATPEEALPTTMAADGGAVDLRPATDDRPFFFALQPGAPRMLLGLLGASVALTAAFSLALLRTRSPAGRPVHGCVIYFAALGAAFMLVEIPLIQKFILLLGHPTASLTAVLFYLLAAAGLGSRLTQRWPPDRLLRPVSIACLLIGVIAALYATGLSPVVDLISPGPLAARLVALGILVLPLGVAMGIPFPAGLRMMSVDRQREIPWMWGVNGLTSVAGGTAAVVGAKTLGLSACLALAAIVYAAIALSVRRLGIAADTKDTAAFPRSRSGPPRSRRGASRSPEQASGRGWPLPALALPLALMGAYLTGLAAIGPRGLSLHEAALKGETERVASLLRAGADVNARDAKRFGWQPLHAAAFAGRVDVARLLLAAGADANATASSGLQWTPLAEAAFAGNASMVRLLLAAGADPAARDPQGRTALHISSLAGAVEPARLLLAAGADANARDKLGRTALHEAALFGLARLVDTIVAGGGDVNARDGHGVTPLHIAASRGYVDVVQRLLRQGADVGARDEVGLTALHFAAAGGQRETVAALLEAGADPGATDADGRTPLWWAQQARKDAVVELLRPPRAAEAAQ